MEKKVILYTLAGTAACLTIYLVIKKTRQSKLAGKKAKAFSNRRSQGSGEYFGEYTL